VTESSDAAAPGGTPHLGGPFAPGGGGLAVDDLRDAWRLLDPNERIEGFRLLGLAEAEEFFSALPTSDQLDLIQHFTGAERRHWMRMLAPDDAADLLQKTPDEQRVELMQLFDEPVRREVNALLAYAEDDAGGLMSPRYARVRPEMTVDEAILYLRRQAFDKLELIYYGYVLDREQRLLGVVSFRDLFRARGSALIKDVMKTDLITVPEEMDQEAVGRIFAEHDLVALPVVDAGGRLKGIVTVDDIVDVVQEEATEDIQKMGGTEALEAPYLEVGWTGMVRKRVGWLVVLFLGEMLTATAMARYEDEIKKVVVLATFIPLIMSSGGNSGSQASTLMIRALALGEVKLADWWRVMRREILTGTALGIVLGAIGFVRIVIWQHVSAAYHGRDVGMYGEHYLFVGLTIALSVLGVVLWGSFAGSMLPIALRRLKLDPASASAPFVATLVDVTGLVIYFTFANLFLQELLTSGG
jgi:magnesium transporter